jgi:hypothetical protein
MNKPQNASSEMSRVRFRAPCMDARLASSLATWHSAARDLIAAAQQLLFDKYWLFFANPGDNSFAKTFTLGRNFHLLQNHQLELIAKEFQLLGGIPLRRRPAGLAAAYVRLLHELLHWAERSGSKDGQLLEGATQYLAIYAYLDEVPDLWISHARADFSRQTRLVAELVDARGKYTVAGLARAYFGNGDFNTMFRGIEGNTQGK